MTPIQTMIGILMGSMLMIAFGIWFWDRFVYPYLYRRQKDTRNRKR